MYSSVMESDVENEPVMSSAAPSHSRSIAYGRFLALPSARTILLDGVPVSLGARAFDLLMVLLKSRGEVIDKQDIIRQVWPTTTVDESNLRFQMVELRKALGNDRHLIKTIPGRGYLLAVDVEVAGVGNTAHDVAHALSFPRLLPHQRAVGEALCALLQAFHRYPDAIEPFGAILAREVARTEVSVQSAVSA